MKHIGKMAIAATIALGAFGASTAIAGNGDMDQLRLRDASCADQAQLLLEDDTLTMDQVRQRLRDGSCLLDDDMTDDETTTAQVQTRTRTGEDNGSGNVWRHRSEGGSKAQSGRN